MIHIALPTYEFHPVNPGGAGVFIAGAARLLARAGFKVTVVADFPSAEVTAAQKLLDSEELGPGSVRLRCVPTLLQGWAAQSGSLFEQKSAAFAEALRRIHADDRIDVVEFPEYGGMALVTLESRARGGFPRIPVVCRLHGGLEFIDTAEGVERTEERVKMYEAEARCVRLADALLTPSDGLGALYARTYSFDRERLVRSPPPMEVLLKGLVRDARLPDPAHFMLYGKLQEVKGVDTFAQAGVSLVESDLTARWRFTMVGRDTFCNRHGQMTSGCLAGIIPEAADRAFEFVPFVNRQQLPRLVRTVQAAVVPSRFETFCLAAHELRAVGVPLIVPRLDGFVDYLNEDSGCLTYDGTASGLAAAISRLRHDLELAQRLEDAPAPSYGSFALPYGTLLQRIEELGPQSEERAAG